MAKVKTYEVKTREKERIIGDLFDVISRLKTKKEIVDFFLGLLTASEALMIARRIQIAKMLINGNSYQKIKKELGVASHTIHKTDQWLHDEINAKNNWLEKKISGSSSRNKKSETLSRGSMLNKYAHHRFLRDLFS